MADNLEHALHPCGGGGSNCPAGNLRHRAWDCRLLAAKYMKKEPKIHEFGLTKTIKINNKSSNNQSKIDLGGCLGGSWGPLNPKMAPRVKRCPKIKVLIPYWGPSWGPASIKIGSKSDPKCDQFVDRFGN